MKRIKRILLGVIGAAAFSLVAFLGSRNHEADTGLVSLFTAGDADAECMPFVEWSAHGRCLTLAGVCVFDTEKTECNPYGTN